MPAIATVSTRFVNRAWPASGLAAAFTSPTCRGDEVASRLFRRHLGSRRRVVIEHRGEPLLCFLRAPALAPGIVFDLIALDLANPKIVTLRVAEIEAAHRG